MKTLDLHKLSYEDAERAVSRFINKNWDAPTLSLKIITGHSAIMRKKVINILNQYELDYMIGGYLHLDDSYIII